jgi:hypothetical protein
MLVFLALTQSAQQDRLSKAHVLKLSSQILKEKSWRILNSYAIVRINSLQRIMRGLTAFIVLLGLTPC